jgi:hypothetical protein
MRGLCPAISAVKDSEILPEIMDILATSHSHCLTVRALHAYKSSSALEYTPQPGLEATEVSNKLRQVENSRPLVPRLGERCLKFAKTAVGMQAL